MATEGRGDRHPPEILDEVRSVIRRAKGGDATVLPQLREWLENNPDVARIYGDIAKEAEAAWVALASGTDLYLREKLTRSAAARRAELTRPGAPPVEQLLVERVVATGLELNYFSATEASALAAGDAYRALQFHAKRLERAQRMHLAALGALTAYQRLVPVPASLSAALPVQGERHQGRQCTPEPPVRPRVPVEPEAGTAETGNRERERIAVVLG